MHSARHVVCEAARLAFSHYIETFPCDADVETVIKPKLLVPGKRRQVGGGIGPHWDSSFSDAAGHDDALVCVSEVNSPLHALGNAMVAVNRDYVGNKDIAK
ncbi:hypothetical protein D6827_02095 [Candidatus Parcubacteria bacterium]|nr:MAG: hypothetical protein D6827_02095 [Candidatus Parcubacteria bacterium]